MIRNRWPRCVVETVPAVPAVRQEGGGGGRRHSRQIEKWSWVNPGLGVGGPIRDLQVSHWSTSRCERGEGVRAGRYLVAPAPRCGRFCLVAVVAHLRGGPLQGDAVAEVDHAVAPFGEGGVVGGEDDGGAEPVA